ncbi:porin family protein [Pedobacter sp.]|uniref:porin family protein n=1 Tax=Pedobacter sp. TaxID=1411316 RepID=UPI003D7F2D76
MKKIFMLAAGLFLAGAVHAQSPIRFGIKGGLNLSNIIKENGNNNFDTKINPGFNVGVTVDIPLSESIAFTPEALYSTKGYKLTSGFGEYTQTTSFIDIPILASIKLAGTGLNVVVGPQVSFLTSTKNKFKNDLGTIENEVNNNSDNLKKSLFGGVLGLRYDINQNIDFHARYALDFQKNNENGTTSTPEYKNQVISLGFGYKF